LADIPLLVTIIKIIGKINIYSVVERRNTARNGSPETRGLTFPECKKEKKKEKVNRLIYCVRGVKFYVSLCGIWVNS
jgi:hypothetical protein